MTGNRRIPPGKGRAAFALAVLMLLYGNAIAQEIRGRVREFPVPTPLFAGETAVADDGSIFVAIMRGNRIARFDPGNETFREWDLPRNASPLGLVTDDRGKVWYAGHGNATLGQLDALSGVIVQHQIPTNGAPHTLLFDGRDTLWFTDELTQSVVRFDRTSGRMVDQRTGGNPYGLAVDRAGNLWFCKLTADRLGRIDARTGAMSEVFLGNGSRPRRVALAPDGTLWVTLNGLGKLAQVDPGTAQILRTYDMPGGSGSNPFAVAATADGRIWANEYRTDTISLLDPRNGSFRSFQLPSRNPGVRKMVVDAQGRLWYMGSHNGMLGVIE